MKHILFGLTLISALPLALRSAVPLQNCEGCIQTSTEGSDTEATATLEIEKIPATYVGGTWTGGSRNGTCVDDDEGCVQARRCRNAWLVELAGANSFTYEVCERVARGGTTPSPWPWDCETKQVSAGS
ncbi:MAG: hypothetical protein FJ298_03945 [Planctomycetes bacterium]|nr:hypothetical protein [Planctomycetota bacterium]